MLQYLKRQAAKLRSSWFPLSQVPEGFLGRARPGGVYAPHEALTLSPFWAALRLYQRSLSLLPLVTYQTDEDGGRTRIKDTQIYNLLHDRPNPAMSRATLFEFLVRDYFIHGECFCVVQWSGNNRPLALYPVPARQVLEVTVDDAWNKTYKVQTLNGLETYRADEMVHVIHYTECGLRGIPFLRFAAESLGLHRQVLEAANAYYRNAINPSGVFTSENKVSPETKDTLKEFNQRNYAGAKNTGAIPLLPQGVQFNKMDCATAKDAEIITALGASVADLSRWFDLSSPLLLGDLSRGTYSNLAADNLAFYQRSLSPLLNKFELEINHCMFRPESGVYCEFLTEAILRADPLTQAQINQIGVQNGYILRSECREWSNLPPQPGLDAPVHLANLVAGVGTELASTTADIRPDPTPDANEPVPTPPLAGMLGGLDAV